MPRAAGVARPVLTEAQKRQRLARRVLAARGLVEAVTWSFIPPEQARLFGGGAPELDLEQSDLDRARGRCGPRLLPGLITAAQRNRDRGFADGALFELGQAYRGAAPEDQFVAAAGVRFGHSALQGSGRHWSGEAPAADVFAVKADAVAALAALGIDQASLTVDARGAGMVPSRTLRRAQARAEDGARRVRRVPSRSSWPSSASMRRSPASSFISTRSRRRSARATTKPALDASDLQAVRRDFAFLLDGDVAAGDVVRAASSADRALIAEVGVFDVFTGQGVPEGKKSLAIEVTLQPRDKTLTDAEIEAVAAKIVAAVTKATGGELRGYGASLKRVIAPT